MAGQEGGPMLRLRIRTPFLEREEEQGKVLVLILGDLWRSEVNFHVKRKTKMETLKTLCAKSVAARVTSEKYLRHRDERYQEEPVPDGTEEHELHEEMSLLQEKCQH